METQNDKAQSEANKMYLEGVVNAVKGGKTEGLTESERVIGHRYLEAQKGAQEAAARAQKLEHDLAATREEATALAGKGAGLLEALLAMRPRDASKDNGAAAPAEVDQKEEEGANADA